MPIPVAGHGKPCRHHPLAGFQYHNGEALWLQLATGQQLTLMRETDNRYDDRERFDAYFRHYYASLISLDKEGIVGLLDMHNMADASKYKFKFRTAAEKFRLIDEEGQTAVIVRYGESPGLVASLEASQSMEPYQRRAILRKLQRYTVNIREHECKKLMASSDLRERFPGIFVLVSDGLYRPDIGLVMDEQLSAASLAP